MEIATAIWKYPLTLTSMQEPLIPIDATILCVQMQDGIPTLWARVNPLAAKRNRKIFIFGTGHKIFAGDFHYIGTIQDRDGLVWHFFEEFGQ